MMDRDFTRSLSRRTRTSAAYWSAPLIVSSDFACAFSRSSCAFVSASRRIAGAASRTQPTQTVGGGGGTAFTKVVEGLDSPLGIASTPSESDRLRPQQAGFDHHFVKPIALNTLLGLLKTLG